MNPKWNQEAVDRLYHKISGSFRPAGTTEIVVFLLIVIFIVLLFFTIHYFQRRNAVRLRIRHSERSFLRKVRSLHLTPTDLSLINSLACGLLHPEEEKHLLVRKRDCFDSCVGLYLAREAVASAGNQEERDRDLLALRVRLGFTERAEGKIIRNTADLSAGVVLTNSSGRPLFRLLNVLPGYLLTESLAGRPAPGRLLELLVSRPEGKYSFETTVMKIDEDRVQLQHSAQVQRLQKRDFYRYDVVLPARLGPYNTRTRNMSGGGACLELPDGLNTSLIGERRRLKIELAPADVFETDAIIINVREKARLVHVAFLDVREGRRDHVIGRLRQFGRAPVP